MRHPTENELLRRTRTAKLDSIKYDVRRGAYQIDASLLAICLIHESQKRARLSSKHLGPAPDYAEASPPVGGS